LLALAAALVVSSACRRSSGPPPERFLAARTEVAIVVPDLRRAAKDLAALQDTTARFPGTGSVRQLRGMLSSQLGFDPLDPDAVAQAGIDPSRGLAVGIEPAPPGALAPTPVVILPVKDVAALEAVVARVARERLGASRRTENTEGALRIWSYAGEGGGAPSLVLASRGEDRTAALSSGARAGEAVRAALSRAPADALAEVPAWRELRKAIGDRYSILAATTPGGATLRLPHHVVLGATAEPGVLRVGLAVRLAGDAAALRGPGGGGSKQALRALSPDAPLALRWDGDPAALGRLLLPGVPARDRRWLAEHGFDLQQDLFDVLAPGAAASISLSPRLDLREFSEADVRADPLRVVRFEIVGDVKDEAHAARALAKLPGLFAALRGSGEPPRPADASGRTGRIVTPSGELAWRLDGKRLLAAGGAPGALDALAARTGPGWTAPSKASAAALEGGLGGAVLAPRTLASAVRGLPDEAYGSDPAGFLMRSIVESFLAPLDRLQAVSARADLGDAALVVSLEVEAAPPPAKKAKEDGR
ncbi:MAG TPA: hypothetical protein VEB43_10825, partial [Anaeromyxobacter sp.]|nr:hypothetical protein [Anaeromyxobacter sp.]